MVCKKCGGETEIAEFKNKNTGEIEQLRECLSCGRLTQPCEIVKRVCGYLTPLNRWNRGKLEEQKVRKTFTVTK